MVGVKIIVIFALSIENRLFIEINAQRILLYN